jgi:hypothetical protein
MTDPRKASACVRLLLVATLLLASTQRVALAQAQDGGTPPFEPMLPKNPQEALAKTFGSMMKLNATTSKAFSLAKAAVNLDPFAVVDALVALLTEDGAPPSITVTQARDEILGELRRTQQEQFVGRAEGLLTIFAQLMDDPHNMLTDDRLALYLNDATTLHQELQTILRNGDPARAATVASLVPVYNTVTSSLIVGLTMAKWDIRSIESVYVNAIETNQALVSDDDQYGGYLYTYTVLKYGHYMCCAGTGVCQTCWINASSGDWTACGQVAVVDPSAYPMCPADMTNVLLNEERRRIDSDPLIYLIRSTVTEQQLALLPG